MRSDLIYSSLKKRISGLIKIDIFFISFFVYTTIIAMAVVRTYLNTSARCLSIETWESKAIQQKHLNYPQDRQKKQISNTSLQAGHLLGKRRYGDTSGDAKYGACKKCSGGPCDERKRSIEWGGRRTAITAKMASARSEPFHSHVCFESRPRILMLFGFPFRLAALQQPDSQWPTFSLRWWRHVSVNIGCFVLYWFCSTYFCWRAWY